MSDQLSREPSPCDARSTVPSPRESAPSADLDALTVAPSQPRPGLLLVRVLGELDQHSAPRCARVLHAAIDAAAQEHRHRDEHARVVCDVADVDFLGTSGLAVLVDEDAHARANGVEMVVVVGDGRVRRLIRLTGLDQRLRVAGRMTDAVPG